MFHKINLCPPYHFQTFFWLKLVRCYVDRSMAWCDTVSWLYKNLEEQYLFRMFHKLYSIEGWTWARKMHLLHGVALGWLG
jgi:hypothetical protein